MAVATDSGGAADAILADPVWTSVHSLLALPLDTPLNEAHRYHNYPIPFVLLYYLLRINGLRLERLGHGRVKPFSWV